MPEAVILDPYRPYAAMLIDRLYFNHGIRTICLHQDWKERLRSETRLPILRSSAVAGHFMVTHADWATVADRLAERYDIVGVLPYEEGAVGPLAELAADLGLSWSQPEVQTALRDKFALKDLLERNDPTLRVNTFAKVTSAEEALQAASAHDLQRYVLKPNDGSGNNGVAFFDRAADPRAIASYFDGNRRTTLLEEFISGPEFWVNGQADAHGEPTVVGLGEYYRIAHNGVENLQVGGVSIAPGHPQFEVLRDYATRIVRAIGLRRSPFHLEVIIDDDGPCLVEVAGRFGGELGTVRNMYHHGPQLDLLDAAAHYYVSEDDYGPLPLDWDHVATRWMATAIGDSSSAHRLVHVNGVRAVEQSPYFLFWIKEPAPGNFVQRTTSLTTRPWAVALTGPPDVDPYAVIDWVRSTLRLEGTKDRDWTPRQKLPMYAGLAHKAWSSIPRPYEAKALVDRIQ